LDKKEINKRIVSIWTDLVESGMKLKNKRFNKDRRDIMRFYSGDHSFIYDEAEAAGWAKSESWAQMTINLTFEMIEVFGPILYQNNPIRTITSRGKDPVKHALSRVMEAYLNYTPNELGLKIEAREAINDALISGLGMLWTSYDRDTGLVGSTFESVENMVFDPDAKRFKDMWWVARRRVEPVWVVERLFPETAKGIKGNKTSYMGKSLNLGANEKHTEKSVSQDLVVYYEVYSKMGVGVRYKDAPEEVTDEVEDKEDNVHIIFCPGHDRPLSIESWPAPLFLDGKWFHTPLYFHAHPSELYPIAPLKPALGEQKAIDFLATFMLAKAKNASRDVIGVDPSVDENVISQISSGRDLEVVSLTGAQGRSINEVISWLEHPGIPSDLKETFRLLIELFQQRTGLQEILYGRTNVAERSARAITVKDRNSRARIDDKAEMVEYWMNEAARKEAILARFLLDGEEVEAVVGGDVVYGYRVDVVSNGEPMTLKELKEISGDIGTYFETEEEAAEALQTIMPMLQMTRPLSQINIIPVTASVVWQDTGTLEDNIDIIREFSYRIEAGSARRPDQELRVEQAQMVMEMVGQMSLQLPPEVDVETYNKSLDVLYDAFMIAHPQRVYLTPQPELPQVIPGQGVAGEGNNLELSQANIPQGPLNTSEMGIPMPNLPTSGAGML
tara:strand:- start:3967 stop:5985 length:2019 start_codon:yes stop_codon:yes gene_type:complete